MRVEIDPKSGFCFGVVRAIRLAERQLATQGSLLCLGEIVHNGEEVERLKRLGLDTVQAIDASLPPAQESILFRAHGEPPVTYQRAQELGLRVVDATCPVVLQLQRKVKAAGERLKPLGGTVVIFGKPDHAEVIGLMGQTDCQRRVVHGTQDLEGIDFTRPIECFSQTTMSPTDYRSIASAIRGNMVKALGSNDIHLVVHETCCSQVASRQEQLVAFAQQHDVVLFVSGKKSSNGQMLCKICQQSNPRTHMVSHPEEVQESWLENAETVGICGATSTPLWLMQAVASRAEEIGKSQETQLPVGQPCSTR